MQDRLGCLLIWPVHECVGTCEREGKGGGWGEGEREGGGLSLMCQHNFKNNRAFFEKELCRNNGQSMNVMWEYLITIS